MKVEYINPFVQGTTSVFSTMLGWELQRGGIFAKNSSQPEFEVSGIIGLSGRAVGCVVLSMSRSAALQVAESMLGETASEINDTVVDAVGELANMIAGSSKAKLEQFQLSISIPTVIIGKGFAIAFPKEVPRVCIPFDSPYGPLTLEIGFKEGTPAGSSSNSVVVQAV